MSNELIVIERSNAISILSTDEGIKALLDNVRSNIDNMDGGSMKNKASRAKIKSNAFKATKAFTKINDETIIPLIASLTAKIQPQIDIINAVKANQSVLKNGLQQIRKDVNSEVDAFEAEIQRIEDEKALASMIDDAYKIDSEFNLCRENQKLMAHMDAININHEFDKQKAIDIESLRLIAEQEEKDRFQYEKDIAETAAKKAREDAERDAQIIIVHIEAIAENSRFDAIKAKEEAESQRKAAIQADIEAEELREQIRINEEIARSEKANREIEAIRIAKEAEENRAAQEKERKRLSDEAELRASAEREIEKERSLQREKAAADSARAAEFNRQAAEREELAQLEKTRAANIAHSTNIKKEMKESLIEFALLTEEQAINVVKAMCKKQIKHGSISF